MVSLEIYATWGEFNQWIEAYFRAKHGHRAIWHGLMNRPDGSQFSLFIIPDKENSHIGVIYFLVETIAPEHFKLIISPADWHKQKDYSAVMAYVQELKSAIERHWTARDNKPPKPEINAPHDAWFNWYHIVTDELDYKMGLKELAAEMGLTYKYVRRLHLEYQAQFKKKT